MDTGIGGSVYRQGLLGKLKGVLYVVGHILPVVCRTSLVSHKATKVVSVSGKTSRAIQSGDIGQVLRSVSWS